jgi:hypothetical protein
MLWIIAIGVGAGTVGVETTSLAAVAELADELCFTLSHTEGTILGFSLDLKGLASEIMGTLNPLYLLCLELLLT